MKPVAWLTTEQEAETRRGGPDAGADQEAERIGGLRSCALHLSSADGSKQRDIVTPRHQAPAPRRRAPEVDEASPTKAQRRDTHHRLARGNGRQHTEARHADKGESRGV